MQENNFPSFPMEAAFEFGAYDSDETWFTFRDNRGFPPNSLDCAMLPFGQLLVRYSTEDGYNEVPASRETCSALARMWGADPWA